MYVLKQSCTCTYMYVFTCHHCTHPTWAWVQFGAVWQKICLPQNWSKQKCKDCVRRSAAVARLAAKLMEAHHACFVATYFFCRSPKCRSSKCRNIKIWLFIMLASELPIFLCRGPKCWASKCRISNCGLRNVGIMTLPNTMYKTFVMPRGYHQTSSEGTLPLWEAVRRGPCEIYSFNTFSTLWLSANWTPTYLRGALCDLLKINEMVVVVMVLQTDTERGSNVTIL
jgi:hypothetical protein